MLSGGCWMPSRFGGPGHVLFFGDGDEIAEVAQFHVPYVSDIDF